MNDGCVVAVDPGLSKCGVATVCESGAVLDQCIVPRCDLVASVLNTVARHCPVAVVIGDRTGSRDARLELEKALQHLLVLVEEHETTMLSRARYYRDHPRRGLARFLPEGLFTPPRALDDYAAVILGERYWAGKRTGTQGTG
jgi:RNase H-fold protein (predicted Holliday junction resolvase)